MVLKIFRAADAFLYLPTYVAEEYEIFDTLLKPLGIDKVEFVTSQTGDLDAILQMLNENDNSNDSIAIAIADPMAVLSKSLIKTAVENVRVIGALINKLPFWAVNHTDRKFESPYDFKEEFSTVVYYNRSLLTGHYLGTTVSRTSKINGKEVDFGNEITLISTPSASMDKAVAITADIISLVRGQFLPVNPLKINYYFSKDGSFLTTGIITAKNCCCNNEAILSKIIEAIQKSIAIIYSSATIGERICKYVSKKDTFSKFQLSTKEVRAIIKLINEEEFYPADLDIQKDSWNKAVEAFALMDYWQEYDKADALENSYEKFVDNTFVLQSEKSLAKQFGISLETFEQELTPLKAELNALQMRQQRVYPFLYSLGALITRITRFFARKRVLVVIAAVSTLAMIYLLGIYWVQEDITRKDVYLTVFVATILSVVGTLLSDGFKMLMKKNN